LRAIAFIAYANELIKAGSSPSVQSLGLWTNSSNLSGGAIAWDLDYAVTIDDMQTCDLWEEIRSTSLFWNIWTRRKALVLGAEFAQAQGDSTRAAT